MGMKGKRLMMKKSLKESLKALEADIQHANTLASDYSRECDVACLQMRLWYSPCAQILLFFLQWSDCHLAGALGLIRILIYKAEEDGETTMIPACERKASLKEFYGVIFPLLLQLDRGLTNVEQGKHREDETNKEKLSETEIEKEEECQICTETSTKVVLPSCSHSLCVRCYKKWRTRSQSCPFCRDSLKRVNSSELWIYTCGNDIADLSDIASENLKMLFLYVERLPLVVPDPLVAYDPLFRDL